jgi:hypothetical protein
LLAERRRHRGSLKADPQELTDVIAHARSLTCVLQRIFVGAPGEPYMTITTDSARCVDAHTHASKHRLELTNSALCGCFFCFRTFATTEIKSWIDGAQTALCPKCGVDAVIGSASGHLIESRFLRQLHTHYFSYRSK